MKFRSTRGLSAQTLSFSEAVARGLAPDGGLYVPLQVPQLSKMKTGDLATVAEEVMRPFVKGDALEKDLASICKSAFDFPTPVRTWASGLRVLELFHGPTAAFKDVGARFLAEVLSRISSERPRWVIVATSGDTGGAVAASFYGKPGVQVAVLYPQGRISPRQEKQIAGWGGNVLALAVDGTFDDCQNLAKQALVSTQFRQHFELTSANSISLGRWLPQMSYYAQVALEDAKAGRPPTEFVIPTGNLGNAMAAILARAMGVPIGRIHLATNANLALKEYFAGQPFAGRETIQTLANAMDVGQPSNFERLRWLFPNEDELRREFDVQAFDDESIRHCLIETWVNDHEYICPHTATAILAAQELKAKGKLGKNAVIVATAHAAKFETVVEPLLAKVAGETLIPIPAALRSVLNRESHAVQIPNDLGAVFFQMQRRPGALPLPN